MEASTQAVRELITFPDSASEKRERAAQYASPMTLLASGPPVSKMACLACRAASAIAGATFRRCEMTMSRKSTSQNRPALNRLVSSKACKMRTTLASSGVQRLAAEIDPGRNGTDPAPAAADDDDPASGRAATRPGIEDELEEVFQLGSRIALFRDCASCADLVPVPGREATPAEEAPANERSSVEGIIATVARQGSACVSSTRGGAAAKA